jgi:transitional endoplasmic reticulum ATPase
MSTSADDIRELAAACLVQPGIGGLLRALLAAVRAAGPETDFDAVFGTLDPTSYKDAALVQDVGTFLNEANRPDLARRWAKPEPTSGVPHLRAVAGTGTTLPSGEIVSLNRARAEQTGETPKRERVTLDDVAGIANVKDQIRRRIIQPFQAKGLYATFKRKAGGGVLMYGPPGCGKTMLARATAHACDATFMPVEISEILSKWVGDSEKRMKQIFENARRQAPAILFFDEVEALARKRTYGESSVDSMVSVFLSEFDGLTGNNEGVLVLAATNVPWSVDAAFRRPGRFDRTLFVPPPDREARLAMLQKVISGLPHVPGLDVSGIAESTSGFSGADLAELVATASDIAIDESLKADSVQPITLKHLLAARKETRATTLEWLTTARNYAEYANRDGAWDDLATFLRDHS